MLTIDIETQARQLERQFDAARLSERSGMRPQVQQIIRTLKAENQPLPPALRRLEKVLEQDAFDDMVDNMPV